MLTKLYRYYARSLVFVSPHHLCWDPSRTKRLKRRFGHVKKSDQGMHFADWWSALTAS